MYVIISSQNFQELLPFSKVMSMQKVKVKGQGHRSNQILPQFGRFWTVTWVWIHTWLQKDAQSLKTMILTQIECFQTVTPVWIEEVSCCFFRSSLQFQGQKGRKIDNVALIWVFLDDNSNLNLWMAMKWHTLLLVAWKRFPVVFLGSSVKFQGHPGWKIHLNLIWARLQGWS